MKKCRIITIPQMKVTTRGRNNLISPLLLYMGEEAQELGDPARRLPPVTKGCPEDTRDYQQHYHQFGRVLTLKAAEELGLA
jgi:hypothetical protein